MWPTPSLDFLCLHLDRAAGALGDADALAVVALEAVATGKTAARFEHGGVLVQPALRFVEGGLAADSPCIASTFGLPSASRCER